MRISHPSPGLCPSQGSYEDILLDVCAIWGQGYPSHLSGSQRPAKAKSRAVPRKTCSRTRCVYFGEGWVKWRSGSYKDWKTINSFPKPQLPEADRGGWRSSCFCSSFSQRGKLGFQPFLEHRVLSLVHGNPMVDPLEVRHSVVMEGTIHWKLWPPMETRPSL